METSKNDIVKYDNEVNRLSFTGFDQYDIDMFWAVVSCMVDKGQETVTIDFDTLEKLSGIRPKDRAKRFDMISAMCLKLSRLSWNVQYDYEVQGKRKFHYGSIFRFTGDEETQTLRANVDNDFIGWINDLTRQFTVFEIQEMISLRSKYSKTLYRLLKQWRTTGAYTFHDVAEFRKLLDVPEKYTAKAMNQNCIEVAVKEISELDNSFHGLACEVVKDEHKRGKPITGYRFTWSSESVPEKKKPGRPRKNQTAAADQAQQETKKGYQNRFNNFNQREYDWSEMEKRMLQQSKKKEEK